MFGLSFVKLPPTTYAIQYKNGRVAREGPGLSFFYFSPTSTLVAVPVGSSEAQFIFEEVTADYQQLTVQGQVIFRVKEPLMLAKTLDYALKADEAIFVRRNASVEQERAIKDAWSTSRVAG